MTQSELEPCAMWLSGMRNAQKTQLYDVLLESNVDLKSARMICFTSLVAIEKSHAACASL
jgi:hypothetical protein